MQETAVYNELHPSILCQQHNHPCKVLLKDIKHSGDITASAHKFKSPFKCNFINSSLNGDFSPCDSHQIIHSFTHVKEKLNKDIFRKKLLSNNTRNNHFVLPKSQQQISSNFSEKPLVYPKNNIVENGSSTSIGDHVVTGRLSNGLYTHKNGMFNGIAHSKCVVENGSSSSLEDKVVTSRLRNGFTNIENAVVNGGSTTLEDHFVTRRLPNGLTSSKNCMLNAITNPTHLIGNTNGCCESSNLPRFSSSPTSPNGHLGKNSFGFVYIRKRSNSLTSDRSESVTSNRSRSLTSSAINLQNGNICPSPLPSQDTVKSGKHVPLTVNGINCPTSLQNGHRVVPALDKKQSDCSISNHRKRVKLKDNQNLNNNSEDTELDDSPSDTTYVFRSTQRLSFLDNWNVPKAPVNSSITKKLVELANTCFDIKLSRKQSVVSCRSKKMRSSPSSSEYNTKHNPGSHNTESGVCICEWYECNQKFETVEHLTKHVKHDHIHPARENDVFVCLWRGCKFSNQPSCSFKWLSKHVTGHCDLKPFKCVIFGCDMTFVTQNGLARHVPTHFNESRVRRTCNMTSEVAQKENLNQSKPTKHPSTPSPATPSTADANEQSKQTEEEKDWQSKTRFERFLNQNISKRKSTSVSRKTSNTIKAKVQRATCNQTNNSGYNGKDLRIQHQIIGRCTTPSGSSEVLLAPTLHHIFPHQSFWFGANEFRKRKLTYVDVKVKDLTTDAKYQLYDKEHASRRRCKKRK